MTDHSARTVPLKYKGKVIGEAYVTEFGAITANVFDQDVADEVFGNAVDGLSIGGVDA